MRPCAVTEVRGKIAQIMQAVPTFAAFSGRFIANKCWECWDRPEKVSAGQQKTAEDFSAVWHFPSLPHRPSMGRNRWLN